MKVTIKEELNYHVIRSIEPGSHNEGPWEWVQKICVIPVILPEMEIDTKFGKRKIPAETIMEPLTEEEMKFIENTYQRAYRRIKKKYE